MATGITSVVGAAANAVTAVAAQVVNPQPKAASFNPWPAHAAHLASLQQPSPPPAPTAQIVDLISDPLFPEAMPVTQPGTLLLGGTPEALAAETQGSPQALKQKITELTAEVAQLKEKRRSTTV